MIYMSSWPSGLLYHRSPELTKKIKGKKGTKGKKNEKKGKKGEKGKKGKAHFHYKTEEIVCFYDLYVILTLRSFTLYIFYYFLKHLTTFLSGVKKRKKEKKGNYFKHKYWSKGKLLGNLMFNCVSMFLALSYKSIKMTRLSIVVTITFV